MEYTVRKYHGTDACSWAIFHKGSSCPIVANLTRQGVEYYLDRLNNTSGRISLSGILFLLLGRLL